MDNVDFATALAESHRTRALARSLSAPSGPAIIGECHYCAAKLPVPRRWCDVACRDAWQHDQRRAAA